MRNRYGTYVEPNLEKIPQWRRNGLTEKQVAKKLGIAYSTLRKYIDEHPALSAAIKKGKEDLVENLKDSLYKRALGYEFEEQKVLIEKDEQGREKRKVEKIKKFMHSDVCLLFALKNIASDEFKDTQNLKGDFKNTIQSMVIDIVDENGKVMNMDDDIPNSDEDKKE